MTADTTDKRKRKPRKTEATAQQHVINESSKSRCTGCPSFEQIEKAMTVCINCRKDVEASLTRVSGRRLRKLRNEPTCSAISCAKFLNTITDTEIKLHLACIAWWRFSSDGGCPPGLNHIHNIMTACRILPQDLSISYMHRALKILSPLTENQLTAWFGCENIYQIADLFSGGLPESHGENCDTCALFKQGCTRYSRIGADNCNLWQDKYIQEVATVVAKKKTWNNPCKDVKDPDDLKKKKAINDIELKEVVFEN